jgi:hypothetical protein
MADGREEREERKMRVEQRQRENREGHLDRDDVGRDSLDDWEPERVDS